MPVVSKKQGKFMQAVAKSPEFAKKVGVNQSTGQEFTKENRMKKNYMYGGKVKKMMGGGMTDKMGRAMAAGKLAGKPGMMADAAGRAMMKHGGKVKKMKKGGNTSRMNELEELGRVDAEKGYSAKGKRNLKDEKARVVREIKNKKAGGKIKGYAAYSPLSTKYTKSNAAGGATMKAKGKKMMMGGKVKKMNMGGATMGARGKTMADMKDMEGRAMAAGRLGGSPAMMADARGRAMKHGGAVMKAKGKKMAYGGKVKKMKHGGAVKSSASKRADGIAQRGRTRGRIV